MGYRVVVSDRRRSDYGVEEAILRQCGAELTVLDCRTEEELIAGCADADAILLDMARLTRRVVESLRRCRAVCRYGVGYDNVDVAACTQKGIVVTNVPDYCHEDVSDMAMGLMLCCARQIPLRDRSIRGGAWNLALPGGMRLMGKTLSLLGFGRIGGALARKAAPFGFGRILAFDPYVPGEALRAAGVERAGFEEAVSQADILSLHLPVTSETKGIVNEKTLSLMKPSAILVNTARGALVDDAALVAALREGRIAAAGLDTHAAEPLPPDSPYLTLDNCVLTDHCAYYTAEALRELAAKTAECARAVLEGRQPPYRVN